VDKGEAKNSIGGVRSGGGSDLSNLPPFHFGLIQKQSNPDVDDEWPVAQRIKWLQTAANIFDLMYKGDGGIEVRTAPAQRSPRPNE
jgi:hypothetical protein